MSFCAPWARNVHYLEGPISNSPLIIPKYTFLGKVRGNCASVETQTSRGWATLWWKHAFINMSHACNCLNVWHLETLHQKSPQKCFSVGIVLSFPPPSMGLWSIIKIIHFILSRYSYYLLKFSTRASGRMQGIQRLPTELSDSGYWVIVSESRFALEIPLIMH